MSKQLRIDWTRCDGHGLCARLFPERIRLDEWGFPLLDGQDLAGDEIGAARLVVRSCPRLALTVQHAPTPPARPTTSPVSAP